MKWLRWHPLRFALTALAIAVGVALGFAVHLINESALRSFDRAVRGVNGAAELQVRAASPLGLDELLYPRVATAKGVADASPAHAPAQAQLPVQVSFHTGFDPTVDPGQPVPPRDQPGIVAHGW